MRKSLLGATSALLLAANTAVATQTQPDVEVKTIPVAGSVYMLEGQGGNIGACVGDDGILIIDDQYERMADAVRAALTALNPGPLKFVLNTHYHGDHVGGNEIFGNEATIIAHENVRNRVTVPQQRGERTVEPLDPAGWPVVTFQDKVKVHFNGEDIQFIHLPAGHTDGDGIVFFPKSNVIHMGDLLFSGRYPRVDVEGGGSVDGYLKNLEWVMFNLPKDAKVIPGHGPLSTMDDVHAARDMIKETSEYVKKLIAGKKTLEEIKKAGLPEKFKPFDWQFITTDRWIETLYTAYSK
ncbi:MAG: MBL fold metallo-hydrolase [Candidatus Latescibacteria bacterium]|nr:MBL fold metallo-hydrolase [Candidatus Latescibacterota bacterium]